MRCDSHVHIVGPIERYPQIATRSYQAAPAPLDELRRRAAPQGIARFVIVQPSFYGTDNTLLLETLDALEGAGRGVAVIEPAATASVTLADYARRGVRGVRLNLYSPVASAPPLEIAFAALIAPARDMGWHVEVIAALDVLVANADRLARAGVPVVIDHYGLYGGATPKGPQGARLLGLLRLPNVWLKLSAPYRVSADPLASRPDPDWLAAILAVASERCVWGSDWPHTPPHAAQKDGATTLPYRDLSYGRLVDDFIAAVGSAALAEQIMSANPARLYGF